MEYIINVDDKTIVRESYFMFDGAIKREELYFAYIGDSKLMIPKKDIDALKTFEEAEKAAYDRGYNVGKYDCDDCLDYTKNKNIKIQEAYQRGLNDAWQAGRKICHGALWGILMEEQGSACAADVIDRFSASEAIAEIHKREEQNQKKQEDMQMELHNICEKYGIHAISAAIREIRGE